MVYLVIISILGATFLFFNISGVHSVNTGAISDELMLSDSEISQKTIEATKGNGEAAYRLSLYYSNVRLDFQKAKEWCKRGADLGYPPAEEAYRKVYSNPNNNWEQK